MGILAQYKEEHGFGYQRCYLLLAYLLGKLYNSTEPTFSHLGIRDKNSIYFWGDGNIPFLIRVSDTQIYTFAKTYEVIQLI